MSLLFIPWLCSLFVFDSLAIALDNDKLLPNALQKNPPGATFSFNTNNGEWHQQNESLTPAVVGSSVDLAIVPRRPPTIGHFPEQLSLNEHQNLTTTVSPVWVPLIKGHLNENNGIGQENSTVLKRAERNQLKATTSLNHQKSGPDAISPINSSGKRQLPFFQGLPFDFSAIFDTRNAKELRQRIQKQNPSSSRSHLQNVTGSESSKNASTNLTNRPVDDAETHPNLETHPTPLENSRRFAPTARQKSRQDLKQRLEQSRVVVNPKVNEVHSKAKDSNAGVEGEQVKIVTHLTVNPTKPEKSEINNDNNNNIPLNAPIQAIGDKDEANDTSLAGASKNESNKCEDLAENCDINQAFCRVAPYAKLMRENCAKSCSFCGGGGDISPRTLVNLTKGRIRVRPFTNLVPSTGNGAITNGTSQQNSARRDAAKCRDSSPRCGLWTAKGFCASRFFLVEIKLRFCAKSCGLCHLIEVQNHVRVPSVESTSVEVESKDNEQSTANETINTTTTVDVPN